VASTIADVRRHAPEAAEPADGGFEARAERELLDLGVERVTPLELVLEEGEVLAEHEAVLGRQRRVVARERGEPAPVRLRPVGALAVDEAAAGEELEQVVPALEQLALQGLAAAHDVAHALLGLARDADWRQVARAVVVGELRRVVPVVLALVAGLLRDERRRDHVAVVAPAGEQPMEHVSGAACLVAAPEGALAGEAVEVALQLGRVVRERIDPGRGRRAGGEHGGGDGLLVHVEPDVDRREADGAGRSPRAAGRVGARTARVGDDMGWSSA
jgi:hypothetical protein